MVFLHVYWYLSCLAIVLLLSIKLYVDNMADDLGLGLTMTFSIVECQQSTEMQIRETGSLLSDDGRLMRSVARGFCCCSDSSFLACGYPNVEGQPPLRRNRMYGNTNRHWLHTSVANYITYSCPQSHSWGLCHMPFSVFVFMHVAGMGSGLEFFGQAIRIRFWMSVELDKRHSNFAIYLTFSVSVTFEDGSLIAVNEAADR